MARKGRTKVIYKGTFVSKQSLPISMEAPTAKVATTAIIGMTKAGGVCRLIPGLNQLESLFIPGLNQLESLFCIAW